MNASPRTEIAIQDWRLNEGMDVPDDHADQYILTTETEAAGMRVRVANTETPQLTAEIMVEINNGVPCIHIGNGEDEDMVIHVFATRDGVAVCPDQRGIQEPMPESHFYPHSKGLATLYRNRLDPIPEGRLTGKTKDV